MVQAKSIDLRQDFWHVRFRDPNDFEDFRAPKWARVVGDAVAEAHGLPTGVIVTLGITTAGNWLIQKVMLPAEYTRGEALRMAEVIQDQIEREGAYQPAYKRGMSGLGFAEQDADLTEILSSPEKAYLYARDVIQGRWPDAEAVIAQDPWWAYWYAYEVLQRPFPAAEYVIAQDPASAYWYARDVLHRPFPAAEYAIAQDPEWAKAYRYDVLGE